MVEACSVGGAAGGGGGATGAAGADGTGGGESFVTLMGESALGDAMWSSLTAATPRNSPTPPPPLLGLPPYGLASSHLASASSAFRPLEPSPPLPPPQGPSPVDMPPCEGCCPAEACRETRGRCTGRAFAPAPQAAP
eukprot:6213437-Pleurochrysis_carterae.AAC.1